jgi:membrane protease YdiL (CAAX protease family)
VPRPWSLFDFLLVFLGGLLGSGLFLGLGTLLGGEELTLVLALAGQYIGHLLVLWALSRRRADLGFNVLGSDARYLGAGLLLQLGLAVLFLPLSELLLPGGDSAQEVSNALAGLETTPARIIAVLTAVVVAPVTEELTFRGVLLKVFEKRGRRVTIVVTSLVFAAFHMLGLPADQFLQAAAIVVPTIFIVGVVLAWVTLRAGRLGPAIFIHSGFNLLAALVLLIPSELLEPIR